MQRYITQQHATLGLPKKNLCFPVQSGKKVETGQKYFFLIFTAQCYREGAVLSGGTF